MSKVSAFLRDYFSAFRVDSAHRLPAWHVAVAVASVLVANWLALGMFWLAVPLVLPQVWVLMANHEYVRRTWSASRPERAHPTKESANKILEMSLWTLALCQLPVTAYLALMLDGRSRADELWTALWLAPLLALFQGSIGAMVFAIPTFWQADPLSAKKE